MSLEDAIRGNTAAIIALTEALLKKELVANVEPAKINVVTEIKVEQTAEKSEPTPDNGLTYPQVRELVLFLAPDFRDEIQALNAKHGLKVLKNMLVDPNDTAKGVKDQGVLNRYYEELVALRP